MSPTLDPHRRRSTSTQHVQRRRAPRGVSVVHRAGGGADVIDTSGRGRGYAVLTGGTERSARKRRTQQDALFAQALGTSGDRLFPVIDAAGRNISEDHRFLRPDQVAALQRLQGSHAGAASSGAAGLRARPTLSTASNPFAKVGDAILGAIPGFGSAIQAGQSGRAGIGETFRQGAVALTDPAAAAPAGTARFSQSGGADGGEGPGELLSGSVEVGGRSIPTWAILAAAAALLLLR